MPYITEYNEFLGDSEALIVAAEEIFASIYVVNDNKILQSAESDEEPGGGRHGNVRLLRHYVSVGVVDKPSRRGRISFYRCRQLMQYCVGRCLVLQGFSLRKVADNTTRLTTTGLSEFVSRVREEPMDRMALRVLLDRLTERHANSWSVGGGGPSMEYEHGSPARDSAETVQMVRDARMQIENELAALLEDRRYIEELSRMLKEELRDCLRMQEEIRRRQDMMLRDFHESIERHSNIFRVHALEVEEQMRRLESQLAVSLSAKKD